MIRKIYIKESHLKTLYENQEVTFYEFFLKVKNFLKRLLKSSVIDKNQDIFNGLTENDLLKQLIKLNVIEVEDKIDEVEDENGHLTAKRFIKYKIPKSNFEKKIKTLYDTIYHNSITEDDGGASSCGSVMQSGGNPDSGQYTVPFGAVQKRKIYNIKK